jgi:hypothetical protein
MLYAINTPTAAQGQQLRTTPHATRPPPTPPASHTRHRHRHCNCLAHRCQLHLRNPKLHTTLHTITATPQRCGESEKWTRNKAVVAIWHTITGHAAYPTYDAIATPSIQKGRLSTSAGGVHYVTKNIAASVDPRHPLQPPPRQQPAPADKRARRDNAGDGSSRSPHKAPPPPHSPIPNH